MVFRGAARPRARPGSSRATLPQRIRVTLDQRGEGQLSTRRPVGLAAVVRKDLARSYPPVAANQPKVDEPTNTIGAMHGWGRLTVALMSEFPAVLAGIAAVLTLVMVAAPVALIVWQLTMASKSGTGLVPRSAGGTGAWSARTRPRTCTRR